MVDKKLIMVPIEKIVAIEEFNTRTKGPGSLTELAENMKAVGVLEPLLGKDKENKNGEVEIHAGFRRLAAAKLAGLAEVPVLTVPRRRITKKQMLLENVAENVHRENLNPVDEALAFQRLHEEHEMSLEDISLELGTKRIHVKNRFKLLKLSTVIRDAVHEDRITLNSAFEISKLPTEYHAKYVKIAEDLRGQKLSKLVDRELDKIAKQAALPGTEGGTEPPEDPSAGVTANVRTIRQCSSVITKALSYDETDLEAVKKVNYRVLESDDLKTVAKLFDGMADLIPEETDVNSKVDEEVVTVVEGSLDKLDKDSPVVRQALVGAIMARCKEVAIEKAEGTGKRAKVTYVLAREILDEFFKSE
jgi:ParB/RepB/Spo0J family partition protein